MLEELKGLTRSDMMRFVVNQLKPRTANRLIIMLKVTLITKKKLSAGVEIGSIDEFQLRPKDCRLG